MLELNLNPSEYEILVKAASKANMNIHKFLRTLIKNLDKH